MEDWTTVVFVCVCVENVKSSSVAGCQWLTPIILAIQEAEIRRIEVQCQPLANSLRGHISKKPITKKG
jgi:hypothetical protein